MTGETRVFLRMEKPVFADFCQQKMKGIFE
jgi:hypothetical protein